MDFFETVMGRQFYTTTMPSIAKSLKIIAENIETKQRTEQYVVVRSYSFDKTVEPVRRIAAGKTQAVFGTKEEAKRLMEDDLVAHFNSNGWEDDIVPDIETIESRGYTVDKTDTSLSLSSNEPSYDTDTIYWHILAL